MSENYFSNKWVVITGASYGLGESLAYEFAQKKVNLILLARSEEKLKQVAEKLKNKFEIDVLFFKVDLSVPEQIDDFYKKIEHIEISFLINNAGVIVNKSFKDVKIEEMKSMMDINFWAPVYLTKKILKNMLQLDRGVVVNIASVAGLRGYKKMSGYSSSKSALILFSDVLRRELEDSNIKVLTVCPGMIDTPMYKKNKKLNDKEAGALSPISSKVMARAIINNLFSKKEVLIKPGFIGYWLFFEKIFPRFAKKISLIFSAEKN